MIIYRQITTHDLEYESEKELRNKILREPLGLRLSSQDVQDEEVQFHWIAVDSLGAVVGCVLIKFSGDGAVIRQMAVEATLQGQGVGTELMKRAERTIQEQGIRQVTLHARLSALGFYERLGYSVISEVFNQATLPHVEMGKTIKLV